MLLELLLMPACLSASRGDLAQVTIWSPTQATVLPKRGINFTSIYHLNVRLLNCAGVFTLRQTLE